jgi:AcrR family transcriptional regulator
MTPRSPEASRAVREHAAEGILAAAAKVFAHRGYAGTKVADIAAEAGVSSGLVHHYFETKAEVFRTLIDQLMSSATTTPREALDREGSPLESLRWMLQQMLQGATYASEYYMLALQVQMSEAVPEDIRATVVDSGAEGMALMIQVVERAQRAGEIRRGDPAALMVHLLGAVQGMALQVFSAGPAAIAPDVDVVLGMVSPASSSQGGAS